MRRVAKSVLVPYTASQMFELVDRVELYPQFLPWCGGARVIAQDANRKTARIDIDYHGVRAHFTTDNANHPPESIVVTLEFDLAYEFATGLLERVIGPVFSHIANTFIDAFVKRAERVYA